MKLATFKFIGTINYSWEIKTVDVIIRQNIKSLYIELTNAGNAYIRQINGAPCW